MATRKRNEFLDIADSEDEGSERGYDSEAAEEEKSKGRAVKRRRMESEMGLSDDDEEGGSGSESEDGGVKLKAKSKRAKRTDEDEDEDEGEDEDENDDDDDDNEDYLNKTTTFETSDSKSKSSKKPLDKVKPPKKNKTGVIYFSSLPPYLKPFALKSLIEQRGFSPITRVFLTPEGVTSNAPKRRSNKRKIYTDGWVEFASKKTAKICAETLNASIVGGRKGGWYHDDVWNMKYLRGFKWADLMEQVQRERSEREAKRRIEDARARKEDKVFLSGVEKGKVFEGIAKKNEEKKKRKAAEGGDAAAGGEKVVNVKPRMTFKQSEVRMGRDKINPNDSRAVLADDAKRVLGKIF